MPTLADAILQEDFDAVRQLLRYGEDVNQLDEYGFTPLIEAAIVNNEALIKLLLEHHADPNRPDVTGGTALQWGAENNNLTICKLLLDHNADPNAYNLAGQPVLVMPTLRRQSQMRQLLIKAGADDIFSQDYINTKLLGHMYELVGTTHIIDPRNQFVEVDFEGFFLEITVGLLADSLNQFQNHFAARQLRRFSGLAQYIFEIMRRAGELIRYQQYQVDVSKYQTDIDIILKQEPLLIPVGYEGHAITFIKSGNVWVKCDRREDSRLYDNVMFYQIQNEVNYNELFKQLLYQKQFDEYTFVNRDLDQLLGLKPLTELKVEAQISGNCSWANVEAAIPALFFLILMQMNKDNSEMGYYKTLALNFFHRFREWNKDRALHYCIRTFETGDVIRKACNTEILAAILFQSLDPQKPQDAERIKSITTLLIKSPYEYVLTNYIRAYYFQAPTEKGKLFYELLKEYGL